MDIGPLIAEAHPRQEDVQCLDDRLYEYNASQIGVDDGQWLAIFVRDASRPCVPGSKAGRGPSPASPQLLSAETLG
jgi:hypothetical protein